MEPPEPAGPDRDPGRDAAAPAVPDGGPAADVPPAGADAAAEGDDDLGAISGLSLTGRLVVAVAVAAVAVGAVFHIGMVFLHVAPENTLSQEHSQALSDYIYPEFEQNWKLFAPDPVQANTDVEARVQVRRADGTLARTRWTDLTAQDIARIRHNPFPSHTAQNELRRAWGFYTDTHDGQEHPLGLRGRLSQQYLLDIAARRFGPVTDGGPVQEIQIRTGTEPVASPAWSTTKTDTTTSYRVLPWWAVTPEDYS